jgi:hypothetical protein
MIRDISANQPVVYYWDFDFQGRFEVDVPDGQKPFLALAGGILHGDFYAQLSALYLNQGAVELKRKKDFVRRDYGFSLNRGIRDANGRIVRVEDQKHRKAMMAMPDIVDYRNDTIIDLKTYYIFTPPQEGGIFVTADDVPHAVPCGDSSPGEVEIPEGYQDSWGDLKCLVERKLDEKYESQFRRYREAYVRATERIPTISVYVVLYTKTYSYYHENGYGGMRKLG